MNPQKEEREVVTRKSWEHKQQANKRAIFREKHSQVQDKYPNVVSRLSANAIRNGNETAE